MNRFLSVCSVEEALSIIRQIAPPPHSEEVPLAQAQGRILTADVIPDVDIPGFDRSTVDGFAVRSSDTSGASESMPSMVQLKGRISMGDISTDTVQPGTCMYVPTGGSLPAGADAVVMVEYCEELGDDILIHMPVAPGENVISRGEDFRSGLVTIHAGSLVTSRIAGVLAACGAETVQVSSCPRIGIISTGNELVPVEKVPSGGQIRDVNTWLCSGFVTEYGGIPVRYGITSDDAQSLSVALDLALASCDAVFISGGSSKGDRDMCADIIASRGQVMIHGVAISPGKPTIIGKAGGKPVIGLPGHPASAYIILQVLGKELLTGMTGRVDMRKSLFVRLLSPVRSVQGREDYIRGVLEGENIRPVLGRSGLTNTLVHSDGVIRIPAPVEGYESGDMVEVIVW